MSVVDKGFLITIIYTMIGIHKGWLFARVWPVGKYQVITSSYISSVNCGCGLL